MPDFASAGGQLVMRVVTGNSSKEGKMSSQFLRVGERPFPAGDGMARCGVYEWTPTNPKRHGKFKIRFLSPDGEWGPRTFYVEPLLDLWLTGKPTRFLEQACAYGYKILSELDPLAAADRNVYRLCQALFRNRNEGHLPIRRRFSRAIDFVSVNREDGHSLVTPGLGREDRVAHTADDLFVLANKLLGDALAGTRVVPPNPAKRRYGVSDVLTAYESLLAPATDRVSTGDGAPSLSVPFDTLPGRNRLDLLFTDGLTRGSPWDGRSALRKVRFGLI